MDAYLESDELERVVIEINSLLNDDLPELNHLLARIKTDSENKRIGYLTVLTHLRGFVEVLLEDLKRFYQRMYLLLEDLQKKQKDYEELITLEDEIAWVSRLLENTKEALQEYELSFITLVERQAGIEDHYTLGFAIQQFRHQRNKIVDELNLQLANVDKKPKMLMTIFERNGHQNLKYQLLTQSNSKKEEDRILRYISIYPDCLTGF